VPVDWLVGGWFDPGLEYHTTKHPEGGDGKTANRLIRALR
jgi:hypothetical protein